MTERDFNFRYTHMLLFVVTIFIGYATVKIRVRFVIADASLPRHEHVLPPLTFLRQLQTVSSNDSGYTAVSGIPLPAGTTQHLAAYINPFSDTGTAHGCFPLPGTGVRFALVLRA